MWTFCELGWHTIYNSPLGTRMRVLNLFDCFLPSSLLSTSDPVKIFTASGSDYLHAPRSAPPLHGTCDV